MLSATGAGPTPDCVAERTVLSAKSSNYMKRYNMLYILLISLVLAMGGLLFGYDWVVIG